MTSSKTGNKIRREVPKLEPLADFFRYGSSVGFLFFWSMMVEEIVFQNKKVISWECEPRKMKIGVCGLVIPEIHPPPPAQSNSWFRLHFWMGKTGRKSATKRLKSVQDTLTPYS
jgi:hypothetical protein